MVVALHLLPMQESNQYLIGKIMYVAWNPHRQNFNKYVFHSCKSIKPVIPQMPMEAISGISVLNFF
jgi:hypothetical protein